MSEPDPHPYDLIAVGPRGVYALCMYRPGHPTTLEFVEEALARGDRIERVPVAEAVERHRAYLMQLERFAPPAQGAGSREGERA